MLHLISSQQRRGAEVFAAQLASSIEVNGRFKNGLCSLFTENDDELPVGNLPMFKLEGHSGVLDRLGLDPELLCRLCGVIREYRPDVLVAHGSDTLKYGSSASLFNRKVATVYRNIGTASIWANSAVRVKLNRMFLKRMNAVVSVSEYTRRDFINVYRLPESRVTFIPNGVDATEFDVCSQRAARAEVRSELGLSPTDVLLASVGNLSEEKGHGELLTIISDLTRLGLEMHLVIVGDGPLRQQLEQQAQHLDLFGQVHFLGRRDDIPRVLAGADVFVLPSRTEGMPAVLIEAGLAGLPSVAFDVGGVAEVVEHSVTGLVPVSGDLAGFSESLSLLCRDQGNRSAMGDAARIRCQELFDMPKVASQYEAMFLNVLANSSRGK